MQHVRGLVTVALIALLPIPALTWAQVAAESREKTDKVGEILAGLQAAGFEIVEQRPDFLPFTSPGHKGGFWLMVVRKPAR